MGQCPCESISSKYSGIAQMCDVIQVQSILKPTQGVTWTSGKPENEGGYGAIFLE